MLVTEIPVPFTNLWHQQNYVADWTMSFLWGAVIGTASPIPYFYSVFFIAVLIHRCGRDFERCGTCLCRFCLGTNPRPLGVPRSTERIGTGTALLSSISSSQGSTKIIVHYLLPRIIANWIPRTRLLSRADQPFLQRPLALCDGFIPYGGPIHQTIV